MQPNPSEKLTYSNRYLDTESDILTGLQERRSASTTSEEAEDPPADNFFDSGYFTVGETGEIALDFVYDGGWYRPEVGIFSLEE
ncbi:MAG: hypothetical protein SXA11_23195, partial [Cyanobacteriota bacterium]|nr:hypothetical protein [Cyanobacteriota bacterium]